MDGGGNRTPAHEAGDRYDRAHHGRGWGDALLRHRLDLIAREPVFRWVEIETSQFSRGFFERYGFERRRTVADGFAPGIDLIEMALDMDLYRNPDL